MSQIIPNSALIPSTKSKVKVNKVEMGNVLPQSNENSKMHIGIWSIKILKDSEQHEYKLQNHGLVSAKYLYAGRRSIKRCQRKNIQLH